MRRLKSEIEEMTSIPKFDTASETKQRIRMQNFSQIVSVVWPEIWRQQKSSEFQ
jgi:hypothetical protein